MNIMIKNSIFSTIVGDFTMDSEGNINIAKEANNNAAKLLFINGEQMFTINQINSLMQQFPGFKKRFETQPNTDNFKEYLKLEKEIEQYCATEVNKDQEVNQFWHEASL